MTAVPRIRPRPAVGCAATALRPVELGSRVIGFSQRLVVAALTVMAAWPAPVAADTPALSRYTPAPTSKLVSRQDLTFKTAQARAPNRRELVLARETSDGALVEVARIVSTPSKQGVLVAIQLLPAVDRDAQAAEHHLASLEHLYGLILRQDASARFCLSDDGPPCSVARQGRSQGAVLAHIAAARQRLLERRHIPSSSHAPWRVVLLRPVKKIRRDPNWASVRVTLDGAPVVGASVFFNRAPHSTCEARVGPDGLASCQLIDHHLETHAHGDGEEGPVVARYPGDVRADRVLLPTTQVIQDHKSP